jgi:predicted RNA methylase
MCADKKRVDAYEAAIKQLCPGKIVTDVGAGTGILSFMAADAGASRVYAIEKADVCSKLKREVNKRQLKKIVKVMNCRAEEAPLETIIADVIVSEWMGYFLLCERMLPSFLLVRDKSLCKGGVLIPSRARIIIAAGILTNIEKAIVHSHEKDIIRLEAAT